MPIYNFICNKCKDKTSNTMSISNFMSFKSKTIKCDKCADGELELVLSPPTGKIEKRKEDIVQDIEEEVRDIVRKVKEGDEETISDIYGHTENKLKQQGGVK